MMNSKRLTTTLFRIRKLEMSHCGNTLKWTMSTREKTQTGFFTKKMQFVLKVFFFFETDIQLLKGSSELKVTIRLDSSTIHHHISC